ncbi:MAG TPA: ornithine cyclodeaminase family protein [Vicinamibacteria bacterium]|nr:ornithine cyclodeaminase family protein [Vicinamibacteria bacterium]
MKVVVLKEREIRSLVTPAAALEAVRDAFVRLARGQAVLPGVINLDLSHARGEVHVKGAHLLGTPFFSIKEAAGFYDNPGRGLPLGSGLILVFDAATGFLRAILFDNAFLTELRTASAGALAADLLARPRIQRAAMIGCGSQARYQLESLLLVRRPSRVAVWSRRPEAAQAYAREMEARHGLEVAAASSAREAVEGAELIVTVTPSREPIVDASWVAPGAHVTAVGSDGPDKIELDPALLARADKVVADRLDQCLRLGEIHHAVERGLLTPDGVHAELGEIAAGDKPGRTRDDEITVADLTGVGVQDAAVSNLVVAEAQRRGVGAEIEI